MSGAYIVAEIGQNHQGSVEVAKDMIRMAAHPQRHDLFGPDVGGVDAVKLTKRDLRAELSGEAARRPYTGDNAFASTYGEHRERLELTDEEHAEAYHYAKSLDLGFVETLCAPGAMSVLDHFTPDYLKVASRDLTNHRLLDALAETHIPIILSTGMANERDLEDALDVVTRHHGDITVLHCLSQYPAEDDHLNLLSLAWLQDRLPYPVGYSDHSLGIVAPVVAVALGATVIEKHITLDRTMRGGDHIGAIDRDGLYRMVRDIRSVERAMGEYGFDRDEVVRTAQEKLERSVAAARDLPAGHTITEDDILPLSPGTGIRWPERDTVVGHTTRRAIARHTLIEEADVEARRAA